MGHFIPVQYGSYSYPGGITPHIREIPAHFGKERVPTDSPFSLHTEYSAGARKLSALAQQFPTICESRERDVPLLWTSEAWAEEFAAFVRELCAGVPPTVLEIHPPYRANADFAQFLQRFVVFEAQFRQWAPSTPIFLENRCGNRLGKRFLFCTYQDFLALSELLDASGCGLRIAFDIPQTFTAHKLLDHMEKIAPLLEHMKPIRHNISSIHLWGSRNKQAHYGNLDTMFRGDTAVKEAFLSALIDFLDDGIPRYLVPEVNSSQADFSSIIHDLIDAGFTFC